MIEAAFSDLAEACGDAFDPQLLSFFAADEPLRYELRAPAAPAGGPAPGLLVYISPKQGARMPEAWGPVLDEYNLAWVGAQDSGNEVHVARRVGFALLAPAAAARALQVDPSRMLLSGFSGGGRVASMMMPAYPRQFRGALFICGANPLFTATPQTVDALAHVPMVFLTGSGDFNLQDTRMAMATYQQAGLHGLHLMEVDGMDHSLPPAPPLGKALKYLLN